MKSAQTGNKQAQEDKAQANQPLQLKGEAEAIPLADLRPEALAQRQMQSLADKSPAASRLTTFQKMANPASTQGMQPPVQRVIDPDKVRVAAQTLEIGTEGIKMVEVPKSDKITGITKFGAYPDGATMGIDADAGKSIVSINYAGSNDAELINSPASMLLELLGGAAYDHTNGIVFMTEGMPNYDRNLLHEMGHHKQRLHGLTGANTTTMILEYHNVLLNENLFGGAPRLFYASNAAAGDQMRWGKAKADAKPDMLDAMIDKTIAALDAFTGAVGSSGKLKENDIGACIQIVRKYRQMLAAAAGNVDTQFNVACGIFNFCKEVSPHL